MRKKVPSLCCFLISFFVVTDVVYEVLGANNMLSSTGAINTPSQFYEYMKGPMSLPYAGDAFSGDEYVASGEQFFNGLRLLEDISIRQIRIAGRTCGRTARILFEDDVCFDNFFLVDEEQTFKKVSTNWTVPDPLSMPGTSLYNSSRNAWLWSSAETTQESYFLGNYHLYPGSGYDTLLPRNRTTDFINYLRDNHWIDPKTRAIIVSMVVYSSTLVRHDYRFTDAAFQCNCLIVPPFSFLVGRRFL